MPGYVDITMTSTQQWVSLGHNSQPFMVRFIMYFIIYIFGRIDVLKLSLKMISINV